jgi:hypothetical protein
MRAVYKLATQRTFLRNTLPTNICTHASFRTLKNQPTQSTDNMAHIDLENVGAADARTLMSAEHKALGYRPPPGSLAAEAQAAAAKHPDAHVAVPEAELLEAARKDAVRIAAERGDAPDKATSAPASNVVSGAIDLNKVGEGASIRGRACTRTS